MSLKDLMKNRGKPSEDKKPEKPKKESEEKELEKNQLEREKLENEERLEMERERKTREKQRKERELREKKKKEQEKKKEKEDSEKELMKKIETIVFERIKSVKNDLLQIIQDKMEPSREKWDSEVLNVETVWNYMQNTELNITGERTLKTFLTRFKNNTVDSSSLNYLIQLFRKLFLEENYR